MEEILKFILSLILLFVGIFFTQPAFAVDITINEALKLPDVSVITASDATFELKYAVDPIFMVASATTLGHLNITDTFNITDKILSGKRLMPVAKFKEVETVPKFPYLIQAKQHKLSISGPVGLLVC